MKVNWKTVVGVAGTLLELLRRARKETKPGCATCATPWAPPKHKHESEEERRVKMNSWLKEVKRDFPVENTNCSPPLGDIFGPPCDLSSENIEALHADARWRAARSLESALRDQPWFIQCLDAPGVPPDPGCLVLHLRAVNGGIKKMIPAEFKGFPTKIHVFRNTPSAKRDPDPNVKAPKYKMIRESEDPTGKVDFQGKEH